MNVYLWSTEVWSYLWSTWMEGIYLGTDEILSKWIKFSLRQVPSGQLWSNIANSISEHANGGCWNYGDWRYSYFAYAIEWDDWYLYAFWFMWQYWASLSDRYWRILQLNNDGTYRWWYECISVSVYWNFNDVRDYIHKITETWDITWIQSLWFSDLSAFMNDYLSKSWTFTPAS